MSRQRSDKSSLRGPKAAIWLASRLGVRSTARLVRVHFAAVTPREDLEVVSYQSGPKDASIHFSPRGHVADTLSTASSRKIVPALAGPYGRFDGWRVRLSAGLGVKPNA